MAAFAICYHSVKSPSCKFFWALWSVQMFTGPLFQIKRHIFTKFCLTQWISKLPGSYDIHWVRQHLVNFMGLAGIVNATVYKTANFHSSWTWQIVLIFNIFVIGLGSLFFGGVGWGWGWGVYMVSPWLVAWRWQATTWPNPTLSSIRSPRTRLSDIWINTFHISVTPCIWKLWI